MEVDLCTVADYAQAGEGGKLNIIGVFDRINAKSFPVRHKSMVLILRLRLTSHDSEETHDLQIYCEAPTGEKLFQLKGEAKVGTIDPGQWKVQNHIVNVENLTFQESGDYTFRVLIDGEHKIEKPISVRLA